MPIKKSKKVEDYIKVIKEAADYLTELEEKRQETYDNRTETWQESDKGYEWQDDLDSLSELNSDLGNVVDLLDTVFEDI
jgi:hypothetical protein